MGKEWTIKDQELLRKNYYEVSDEALKRMFPNRTWNAIYNKALTLGLREKFKVVRHGRKQLTG